VSSWTLRSLALLVFLCACSFVPTAAQAQTVTANCDTPPSHRDTCNRWYKTGSVLLDWNWDPGAIEMTGCGGATFTAEARVERSCTVEWADTTLTRKVWIGIDRTPPALVGLRPDRPPGFSGWFTSPVGLTFQGSDRTSGVASCSSTTYSGPDGEGMLVSGTCRDLAGNVGSGSLPINYDATPPEPPSVEAIPGNQRVSLSWRSAPGVEALVVRRTKGGAAKVVYRGPANKFTDKRLRNKRRYRYLVRLIDQAGNRAVDKATAVPTASRLLVPANGSRLQGPPELVWKSVPNTRYYNVQLVRRGKVLSRWPRVARLKLRRSWHFDGRRFRLVPARYCWYVWPGLGAPSERRYGPLLGRGCFTVVRRLPGS
jgi:hypothetical protein